MQHMPPDWVGTVGGQHPNFEEFYKVMPIDPALHQVVYTFFRDQSDEPYVWVRDDQMVMVAVTKGLFGELLLKE